MKRSGLGSLEWQFTLGLVLVMLTVVLFSKIKVYQTKETLAMYRKNSTPLLPEWISVTIQGAVARPGTFRIKPGVSIRKILNKSRPQKNANLRSFDLDALVFSSRDFFIEGLKEIVVCVQFSEDDKKLVAIPAFSRLSDLKSQVEWPTGSDLSFLKSRRVLKDGEIVIVRRQDSTQQSAPSDGL